MTDEVIATVNDSPVDSTDSAPVEQVVDNTPEVTESPEDNSTRAVASKVFDQIMQKRNEEKNTDASKGRTDHSGAKPLPKLATDKPAAVATPEIDPVSGKPYEPIKAPASWTPSLREKWAGVPRDVQKFITDRERDMATTLSKTADERKAAKEWNEVATPYTDFLKQFNTTPIQHAKELFEMSRALNTGTPQQKAQILHNFIMHFKPDFATMQALANGQKPNIQPVQKPQTVDIDAEVNKRLQAQETARQEAEAQSVIDKFANDPANEFYGDVSVLMGKAIEGGLVHGATTEEIMKNAYDLACRQHPEVAGILATRGKTTLPAGSKPVLKPVQSVKPSLGSGAANKVTPKFKSRREAIEAAYDKLAK